MLLLTVPPLTHFHVALHASLCPRPARQKLTLAIALDILEKTVAGIQHLHDAGFTHGDVRASNVLIAGSDRDRVVKLCDFGLAQSSARRLDGADRKLAPWCGCHRGYIGWEDGSLVRWAAPEQLPAPERPVSVLHHPACDMYQFGGLVFEVLTGGQAPFFWQHHNVGAYRATLSGESTLFAATRDAVPLLWRVDVGHTGLWTSLLEKVVALMSRCLVPTPGDRPTAQLARDELQTCQRYLL